MRKLVMALTYPPKIDPVFDGRCTQTIRKGRRVAEGDEILFHDWDDRPYRSKWNRRKRVVVDEVYNIVISFECLTFVGCLDEFQYPWDSTFVEIIATEDFIDPPTGEELRDVLFGLNGAPDKPEEYQIIRWIV